MCFRLRGRCAAAAVRVVAHGVGKRKRGDALGFRLLAHGAGIGFNASLPGLCRCCHSAAVPRVLARCGDGLRRCCAAAGCGAGIGLYAGGHAGRLFRHSAAVPFVVARAWDRFRFCLAAAGIGALEGLNSIGTANWLGRHGAAVPRVVGAFIGSKMSFHRYVPAALRCNGKTIIVCRVISELGLLRTELYADRHRVVSAEHAVGKFLGMRCAERRSRTVCQRPAFGLVCARIPDVGADIRFCPFLGDGKIEIVDRRGLDNGDVPRIGKGAGRCLIPRVARTVHDFADELDRTGRCRVADRIVERFRQTVQLQRAALWRCRAAE